MSEMVDRVALAIAKVIGGKMGNEMSDWITPARSEEARAAIEAMRNMTERMFDASGFVRNADDVIPFWNAVIDAALED